MPRIHLNDIQLYVEDQGHGPPLVLVHGFPLDHTMWRGQIQALAGEFRVVAPDLRGFGRSEVTDGVVTMEQFADDLAGMLDVMGIDQPVMFCGLSMGGYIGWQFWRRHANRLRALVQCDTRAVADPPDVARGRRESAERVLAEGPDVLAQGMMDKLFAPQSHTDRADAVEATRRVMLESSPVGIAAALRGMAARPDSTSILGEIDLPTLVVCGRHDAISTVEEMRAIAAGLPRAQFIEIEDAGHMSPLEAPRPFNDALRAFQHRLR
jgi:pimeloyl-ACP methyl ester carboxylesterase